MGEGPLLCCGEERYSMKFSRSSYFWIVCRSVLKRAVSEEDTEVTKGLRARTSWLNSYT